MQALVIDLFITAIPTWLYKVVTEFYFVYNTRWNKNKKKKKMLLISFPLLANIRSPHKERPAPVWQLMLFPFSSESSISHLRVQHKIEPKCVPTWKLPG